MSPLEGMHMFVKTLGVQQQQSLSSEDLTYIHDLVLLLDAIPLTIKLMAHRVRTIPLQKMKLHFESRFELLGNVLVEGKSASLSNALNWSWDLLSVQSQKNTL